MSRESEMMIQTTHDQSKRNQIKRSRTHGFTLIEMAIVVTISGLLLANFLQIYGNYYSNKNMQITKEHLQLTQSVITEFYGRKGRYPCPANPDLPPTDGNYGRELCPADPMPVGPCPGGIVCDNTGTRDANADGTDDYVLIGAVPFVTLFEEKAAASFVPSDGFDGWNTVLKYAVSDLMADEDKNVLAPVNPFYGAIDLRDENNTSLTNPVASTQYIIMSHGDNRKGGWTPEGDNLGGCIVAATTLPAPPGSTIGTAGIEPELENCDDNDGIFVKGLRSVGDNDQYFDDLIFYNAAAVQNLWAQDLSAPSGELYLYNSNWDTGNIGVDALIPQEALDVAGDIRAEDAIETSGETAADGAYCDPTGADCVKPEFLAGSCDGAPCVAADQTCPAGQAATGIENNQLICANVFNAAILPLPSCGAGEYITGISNLGNIKCAAP